VIVRLRIELPDRRVGLGLAVSLIGHLLLISLVLAAGTIRGTSRPSRPAMMVRLSATQAQPSARPASTSPEPRAEKPETQPPPEKKSEPKREPPKRTRADAPESVATDPQQTTARPEELEQAEPVPEPVPEPEPEPPGEEAGGAGGGDRAGADLPAGPIPGGVAGLETDDPLTSDWYVGLVVARLSNAWRQRPVLPAGSDARRVIVGFTVQRDGRVTDAHVVAPSGYAPLDHSALRAVTSIAKLPPLPRQYERDQLSARFVFELLPPEDR
jgi:TonB family protein